MTFRAGDAVFRRGDPIRHMHVVISGTTCLMRYTEAGSPVVLQRAESGTLLAESSLFATSYHCDGVALGEVAMHRVTARSVKAAMQADAELAMAFAAYLAREVQRMRMKAELLSIRSVRDRLDGWLAFNAGALPPRGNWKQLAGELGVSPEALYRELARRAR